MSTATQTATSTLALSRNRALAEELVSKRRYSGPHAAVSGGLCVRHVSPRVGLRPRAWRIARVGRNTTRTPAGMPASYAPRASLMLRPPASANWRPGSPLKRTP
jgi:hypothetical protein